MKLLTLDQLQASEVVANAAMNRARSLVGVNSYERELHLDVVSWLKARQIAQGAARWLDVCCGEGHALRDAAAELSAIPDRNTEACLVGIDLIEPTAPPRGFRFVQGSVHDWKPELKFDLVTCVHGLHYVGDKLGLLERIARWLQPDGLFVGNLDLADVRLTPRQRLLSSLRRNGIRYDARQHLVRLEGARPIELNLRFLGAADNVGANYTHQPSVHSFYAWHESTTPAKRARSGGSVGT